MYGAIAYENTDTFDAVSRTYNYVFARPWRLGFYTVIAAFYGGICYLFARLFGYVMLVMSRWFLQLSVWTHGGKGQQFGKLDVIWPRPEYFNYWGIGIDLSKRVTESASSAIVYLEILIISGIVIAFAMSFYFSAGTIIYCLLRNKADNIPLDRLYMATESESKAEISQTQTQG